MVYGDRMRVSSSAAIGAAILMLLVGCSQTTPNSADPTFSTPSATPSPTPTIDPGPVELTDEEAGIRYLMIICQRNASGTQLAAAFAAQEGTFLNGDEADATAVKAAAAEALRLNRLGTELFDDPYYVWPENVATHVKTLRDYTVAESGTLSQIANAPRYEDAYYAIWPADTTGGAAQEIRYQLGLSPDTTASCVGYETGTDKLHAEMTERNEYLATFEDQE